MVLGKRNLDAAIHYLKSTPGNRVLFRKNKHRGVWLFVDAGWQVLLKIWSPLQCSVQNFGETCQGEAKSKRLSQLIRSSAETEYRAIAQGFCELIRINRLLLLQDLFTPLQEPVKKLFSDRKSTTFLVHTPFQYDKVKHVRIDRTKLQGKYILTKALLMSDFESRVSKLGMNNLLSSLRRSDWRESLFLSEIIVHYAVLILLLI